MTPRPPVPVALPIIGLLLFAVPAGCTALLFKGAGHTASAKPAKPVTQHKPHLLTLTR